MKSNDVLSKIQLFGRSLLLPVTILPIAAILLRFGSEDIFDIPFIYNAGKSIFSHLSLLFAIGIGIGISEDHHGAGGLAGAVCFLVLEGVAHSINPTINMGVLSGIIAGLIAGNTYNKFYKTKLPSLLSFFSERNFVSIMASFFGIITGYILGFVFPFVQSGLDSLSHWMFAHKIIGGFVYGILERLGVPIGFHHLLNSVVRYMMGEYITPAGQVVMGDQFRFLAGDPTAGAYMSASFIIMMFGLPGAAFAIYKCAKKENKKNIRGLVIGAALTSFLLGITEPIEFLFIFTSPLLFIIHAILMGTSYLFTGYFGILHGFGFSAGAIDYVLNYKMATRPILIIPFGILFFFIYYFIFSFIIKKKNIKTLGR